MKAAQRPRRTAPQVIATAALAAATVILTGCTAPGGAAGGGDPVAGGTLDFGIRSDGTTGFNPTQDQLGASGQMIMRAIYEPLLVDSEAGTLEPYLASAVTPSDDLSTWTIDLRSGITFSDGTPLDADVVVANLEGYQASANFGGQFAAVESIEATDDDTVTVELSAPSSAFLGTLILPIMSPSTLDVVGAGAGDAIGTGPFVLDSWSADSGGTVVRNESYWRDGLPYVDAVDFHVLGSDEATIAAIESGEIQAFTSQDPALLSRFAEREGFELTTSSAIAPTGVILVNPDSDPLGDIDLRVALAQATDKESIVALQGPDVVQPANGPFAPGKPGHLEDTGTPAFDLDAATSAIEEWESENGPLEITITYPTDSKQIAELVQSQWTQAGVDVTLEGKEPGAAILDVLTGNYEVTIGSLPGVSQAVDLKVFLDSSNLNPVGDISTDYMRVDDPAVDGAFSDLESTADADETRAAAEDLNRALGEGVATIWTYWYVNGVVTTTAVGGITGTDLPDGDGQIVLLREGAFELTSAWLVPAQ
jgi:peptide/nickel transport system substrate-binding protein